MEDRYYLNFIDGDFIKNREWKTTNDGTSQTLVDVRVPIWIADDSRERLVNSLHEFEVEIFTLVSVPVAGFSEFDVGFGSKPNDHV